MRPDDIATEPGLVAKPIGQETTRFTVELIRNLCDFLFQYFIIFLIKM